MFIACFAENLGDGNAFHAELSAVMRAIELANQRGWRNLWLETDSYLVVLAFKKVSLIPCALKQMNYVISHTYREGNKCTDKLASFGLDIQGLTIWLEMPSFIGSMFGQDRIGMPNFRFVNC